MQHVTNRRSVTIAVMVATFLTAMDSTVVSTAMPTIVSDLGGIRLISWVFAVYLLSSAVTAPIWGKLADLFGRKGVFQIGTAIFLLGSILSGASGNMDQLIAFRAFQGIGAGAVFPITLTIIGDLYELKERAKIQGLFSAIWGIAGILGPLVGGFFVDALSWRWIFYINIPVGLVSMFLIALYLQERFEKRKHHIDYAGAVTFSVAMTALLYALLSGGQQLAWDSVIEISLFIVAAMLLVIFIWVEKKSPEPMLPLRLFALRAISISNVASFLASGVLIGITVYLPLWIQGILGHSATNAGLTLTPMSIGWPIGATICGRIMFRLNPRWSAVLGSLMLTVGGIWLATVGATTPYIDLVVIMLVLGFGFGFALTVFTVLVQSAVGWQMRGAATASNQFVRSLGQTIGVVFFGSWFNAQLAHPLAATAQTPALSASRTVDALNRLVNPQFAQHLPTALLVELRGVLAGALHNVFVIMAVLSVACFLFVFVLPSRFSDASEGSAGGSQQTAPTPEVGGA
ncbi:MAG: MDR family MFS transporter [Firmicutes bacterium]|nr:MDR family MFS transporter [Bacillota bacterium]